MSLAVSSTAERRERERVIFFKFAGPLSAVALGYGIIWGHPSLLFLAASVALGMAFGAALLWGQWRNRRTLATAVAWGIFWIGKSVIEHAFYRRPYSPADMPWPAYIAELAAISVGFTMVFVLCRRWGWTAAADELKSDA